MKDERVTKNISEALRKFADEIDSGDVSGQEHAPNSESDHFDLSFIKSMDGLVFWIQVTKDLPVTKVLSGNKSDA